jgi:hypothetical protein
VQPRGLTGDAGVVDRAIEAPPRHGCGDQGLDLGLPRHVGSHEPGLAPRRRDLRHRLLAPGGVDVGHHHARSLAGEGPGGGAADPRGRAGDERRLPFDQPRAVLRHEASPTRGSPLATSMSMR